LSDIHLSDQDKTVSVIVHVIYSNIYLINDVIGKV